MRLKGLEKGLLRMLNIRHLFLAIAFTTPLTAFAKLELKGEIQQGGLVIGKTLPNSKVSFNAQTLPVSPNGDFVLGFSRDDDKQYQLQVTLPSGKIISKALKPTPQQYKIQRVEGIAKKIMNPDPQNVKRAKKDSAQVYQARTIFSERLDFSKGFIAPINGTITGVYGSQRFYNGKAGRPHYGLDYAGKVGDPVKAPASGIVLLYVPDMFYSGGTMIIDHGHGISSTFLHLSDSYVKQGDIVKQGQVVAAVGNSGRTTGPHLDWRINWNQVKLDPALALKALEKLN